MLVSKAFNYSMVIINLMHHYTKASGAVFGRGERTNQVANL